MTEETVKMTIKCPLCLTKIEGKEIILRWRGQVKVYMLYQCKNCSYVLREPKDKE